MRSQLLQRSLEPTLRYATFEPSGVARGNVLITPGFAEHVERYREACETFAAGGFRVAVYDLRGQGDSGGERAFIRRFDEYVDDALALLTELDRDGAWRATGKPILFGHSLGALITMHVALTAPERGRALVLGSPYFGQALPTPEWRKTLGRWVSGLWPTYRDQTGITGAMLTRDPQRAQQLDTDPKRIPFVTARWFTEVEAAQAKLFREAPRLTLPVYCLAAGADRIASVEQTQALFARLGSQDKRLEIAAGESHELHQELRRAEHVRTFLREFERLTGGAPEAQTV